MGKFFGPIGYVESVEDKPGVWKDRVTEKTYAGDVLRNIGKIREGTTLNDNLTVDNRLSIVADPFASQNFQSMRYIKWMGAYWKIDSVEVQSPRLILTIGGVYNGPKVNPSGPS
jgi:hypothetical protein